VTEVALSIGSNLGDRMSHLNSALTALEANTGRILAVSSVYESAPVGGPEQDSYLNAAVVIDTQLAPLELLAVIHQIEAGQGRTREVHWGPRTLDIDIVDVVGFHSSHDQLCVPHRQAGSRAFVLAPLNEIAPEWKLGGELSVAALLEGVADQEVILRTELKLVGMNK